MRAVLVAPNAIGGPMAGGDNLLDPDAVAGLNRGHCFGPVGRNAGEFLEKVSLFDSGSNCSIASLAEKIRIARPGCPLRRRSRLRGQVLQGIEIHP